jgi:hypothetical protein
MTLQSIATRLDDMSTTVAMSDCGPHFPFPEIISRSQENFETVYLIPFTYFNLFPTPIVCEKIEQTGTDFVSTIEFIESVVTIIPRSLVVEDVLSFSESIFVKQFENIGETNFFITRILFLMCVISTIKLTSDGSCHGLLTKASEVVIGSVGHPRFRLRQDEIEKIELWYVCEFFNKV